MNPNPRRSFSEAIQLGSPPVREEWIRPRAAQLCFEVGTFSQITCQIGVSIMRQQRGLVNFSPLKKVTGPQNFGSQLYGSKPGKVVMTAGFDRYTLAQTHASEAYKRLHLSIL